MYVFSPILFHVNIVYIVLTTLVVELENLLSLTKFGIEINGVWIEKVREKIHTDLQVTRHARD